MSVSSSTDSNKASNSYISGIPSRNKGRSSTRQQSQVTIGVRSISRAGTMPDITQRSRDVEVLSPSKSQRNRVRVRVRSSKGREAEDLCKYSPAASSSTASGITDRGTHKLIAPRARALAGYSESQLDFDTFYRLGGDVKIDKLVKKIDVLKTSLSAAKNSKGSVLRSALPGGRINSLSEALTKKCERLKYMQHLQERADYHRKCMRKALHYDLLAGSPIHTKVPEEIAGGKDADSQAIQRALVENVDLLRKRLIAQIPEEPLDLSRKTGEAEIFIPEGNYQEFNNYVIHLDMHPEVTFDPDERLLVIPDDGVNKALKVRMLDECEYKVLSRGRKIINIGPAQMIMCDQAKISSETFRNRVFMASFNDGCGWGDASRGAAKKANKIALRLMKEGIERLWFGHFTCRDIINVHDEAVMEAHKAVATDIELGSTCPQLLTVVGDIAHLTLIGDTKCFIIGTDMSVKDPTEGIRGSDDPVDPGGRIGGYKGLQEGYATFDRGAVHGPDLRNYTHCLVKLNPGDIVLMCSDGVGDNLGEDASKEIRKVILDFLESTGKKTLTRKEIARAINLHVQMTSLRIKALSGAALAKSEAAEGVAGKPDHAGMLIYSHA